MTGMADAAFDVADDPQAARRDALARCLQRGGTVARGLHGPARIRIVNRAPALRGGVGAEALAERVPTMDGGTHGRSQPDSRRRGGICALAESGPAGIGRIPRRCAGLGLSQLEPARAESRPAAGRG